MCEPYPIDQFAARRFVCDKITSLAQVFDSAARGNRKLSVKTGYVIDDGNGGKNYSVVTQKADGVIY